MMEETVSDNESPWLAEINIPRFAHSFTLTDTKETPIIPRRFNVASK